MTGSPVVFSCDCLAVLVIQCTTGGNHAKRREKLQQAGFASRVAGYVERWLDRSKQRQGTKRKRSKTG